MANTYEKLHCCVRNCRNKEGIYFGANDGDDPASQIMCSECVAGSLIYIIDRKYYDLDIDEWFRKPYCDMCEQSEVELFIPKEGDNIKPHSVRCLECIAIEQE